MALPIQYSIRVLKDDRKHLMSRVEDIDEGGYEGSFSKENIERLRTKLMHDIRDLEFCIEILESYQDSTLTKRRKGVDLF